MKRIIVKNVVPSAFAAFSKKRQISCGGGTRTRARSLNRRVPCQLGYPTRTLMAANKFKAHAQPWRRNRSLHRHDWLSLVVAFNRRAVKDGSGETRTLSFLCKRQALSPFELPIRITITRERRDSNPRSLARQASAFAALLRSQNISTMYLKGFEPLPSRLSGVRSRRLSYRYAFKDHVALAWRAALVQPACHNSASGVTR